MSSNPQTRRPLYYTFANHMHWVDMQWLWGYDVMPGTARDTLKFCREAGVVGNLNFDGVGYERMAAECADALGELRAAVAAGLLEPVGGSWGQPYGLFQGSESNVRQFTVGVRAVMRHLGTRPRAFWEEEFWFFPQLPQVLAQCGYSGASLFFQWTWHTPEVPSEDCSLILWQGLDGTALPTLPRNGLNLHQWPEDFDPMLESPLLQALAHPVLAQWVEFLPSPDWMCRSEVLLPRLKQLAADERFDFRPRKLSELLAELLIVEKSNDEKDPATTIHSKKLPRNIPTRQYTLDDVWHGMSVGKNADRIPRASLNGERTLLEAEVLATTTAMLGRPYPSWDVYPYWEIDEAWRELLAAQHHDNHECEGLCGFIGLDSLNKAQRMAERVRDRSLLRVARELNPADGSLVVANALPWDRDVALEDGRVMRNVPACGYRQAEAEGAGMIRAGGGKGDINEEAQSWQSLHKWEPRFSLQREGRRIDAAEDSATRLTTEWRRHPVLAGWELRVVAEHEQPWDPGMNSAFAMDLDFPNEIRELIHDHPFAQTPVLAERSWPRKYPSGDWMTSEQWFEEVERPFTSTRMVNVDFDGINPLLILHDGSQSWQRTERGLRVLLNINDPWDEQYWNPRTEARFFFRPNCGLSAWKRHQLAEEWLSQPLVQKVPAPTGLLACVGGGVSADSPADTSSPTNTSTPTSAIPTQFSALQVEGPAACTTFHRIGPRDGEGLDDWAGHDMRAPHLLRLVELDGAAAEIRVQTALPMASAWLCNMMGEKVEQLAVGTSSALKLALRPHQILTVVVDLPDAAKQPRDLDARRKVWAQIHRT